MKKNNKGFSLVELLAVIVILGLIAAIGIGATSYLVDKAKKDKTDSQKNTIIMSAQTYMQNNKNLVPKIIGESKIIKISDLRSANYLTEDIKNDKGESCMEKSYVRVYKLSNSEYTYTTYLYCGSEEIPAEQDVPTPKVVAKFSDSSGEIKDEKLNNVSDGYLYIEMNAATEEEIEEYKNQGMDIAIDGYSFTIFEIIGGRKHESYNSGSLSGGREQKIVINKRLNDYIDVTGVTEVSLEVTAINTLGGITNTTTTIGERGEVSSSIYDDNIPPKCVKPASPYTEGDWLNKSEYNTTKVQRKLTVGCDDGLGSGCIRNYFTMSWPNDEDTKGAEYVYIEVKDNAGNVSLHNEDCMFRVNVDIETPEAEITAFAGMASDINTNQALSNKITGPSILSKKTTVNDKKTINTIEFSDYKKLVNNNTDIEWMNNENYPNGVIYKIELKDNIRLDKWKWETNAGYINSTKDSKYLKVSSSNPDANSEKVPQDEEHGMDIFHGSTTDTVYVRFLTEGMRYGVFTAYDKAGNKIEIKIAANLDRTPPPIPSKLKAYLYNKVRTEGTTVSKNAYSFSTWSNKYVRVQTESNQNRDDLTEGVTLSGFWQFYYDARNNAGARVGISDYSINSLGNGVYDFKGTANEVDGKNKIRFMGCDKAGNCSDWAPYKEVWIDITVPKCTVTKSITSGAESDYGWLGIDETARVTADCSDPTTTLASGCSTSTFYYDYKSQINTKTAGARGNNNAGSFTDNAGNTVNCVADKRIQIDYSAPKCSVSGGSSAWTNGSRTVTGTCSDTGGSGCVKNISHTYSSDINTTTAGAAGNNSGGSVKDKADNVTACAANQTVKVDRTMPYVTVDVSPGTYESNDDIDVTATCHDDLSGLSGTFVKSFTGTMFAPTKGMYIAKCCEDNAGNKMCYDKGPYKIKIYGRHDSCGIQSYKTCRTEGCGVESYKTCSTAACGVASYNSCQHANCGYTSKWKYEGILTCPGKDGKQLKKNVFSAPTYSSSSSAHAACESLSWTACKGVIHYICTTPRVDTNKTCRTSACGVESYKSCENSACGVKRYKSCAHSQCGVLYHKECWHFDGNCNCPH